MMRRLTVLVLLMLAIVAGAMVSHSPNAESAKSATVSAKGKKIQPTRREWARLRGLGYQDVFLLVTIDNRAFYRVVKEDGRTCYGAGFATSIGNLGRITCRRGELPLMDFSIFEVTRGSHEIRPVRVEGIVVDTIARVGVADQNGKVLAHTDVVRNAYHFPTVPDASIGVLVGLDESNNSVATLNYGP
jgi:hypothetical protein